MLKIGEKGAIPQKDNETYAIAPHIPCGIVTPDLLRKIADVSERYNAKRGERLGKMIERTGLEPFKEAL